MNIEEEIKNACHESIQNWVHSIFNYENVSGAMANYEDNKEGYISEILDILEKINDLDSFTEKCSEINSLGYEISNGLNSIENISPINWESLKSILKNNINDLYDFNYEWDK